MATLDEIDHFVVLMLENRSFDNLLGFLYPSGPDFDGPSGTETLPDGLGGQVRLTTDSFGPRTLWMPTPDPGELFPDITEQLFGSTGTVAGAPPMSGFANNYRRHEGKPAEIMHCFTPDQVPALSALARSYAVCDRWFAAAPCQTWPNRFFVHTGTAGGYENNSPAHFPYLMPTIFDALEGKAPNGWEVYFHDFPQSMTLARLWDHLDHFRPFEDFLSDARGGRLPSYAFIEPRYFADVDWPNDMHPPHNITYGDQLVAQVYQALRNSPNWQRTLLVITFDEHGGCYDHVPPPAAVSPEPPRADQLFAFDRLGVRVPAVVVSPWIRPGTRFRSPLAQPFDHTAIIRTLRKRFGIDTPLTRRDANAPDLELVLNLGAPSDEGREPVTANPSPISDDAAALDQARRAPLSDFQKSVQEAMAKLAPLIHGVAPDDHIAALLKGLRSAPTLADSVGEVAGDLRRLLYRLF